MRRHTLQLLAVSATYFALGSAFAADTLTTITSNGTTATRNDAATVPASRIASRFERLAGSPENAASLVAGLRSGGPITLVSTDSISGVRFTPATTQMGYDNITRALSLAQRQLAAQGIAQPTPDQLHVALNGGTLFSVDSNGATRTVKMPGILLLRSQGMGWDRIAHQLAVSHGKSQINASANAQAGRPSFVAGGSSMSMGSHGKDVVQVSGRGSL